MILNSILELFYIDHEIRNKIGKCHQCNDSEKHITRNQYDPLFQASNWFSKDMGQNIKYNMGIFNPEEHTRLNPQDAIHPALTMGFNNCELTPDNQQYFQITKLDIGL